MKLNTFIWNNFLESKDGKKWVDFFSDFKTKYDQHDSELNKFIDQWSSQGRLDYKSQANEDVNEVIKTLKKIQELTEEGTLPAEIKDIKEAISYYRNEIALIVSDDENEEDIFVLDDIQRLSVALYCLFPKYFFPYYFYPNFYALKKIFNEFGIFLPPVPKQSQYDERFIYYSELCQSLYEFWINQGFNPEHIPAFLYGFAPQVVDLSFPDITKLPNPQRAWFVGGNIENNGDFEYLDQIKQSSQSYWQGNKETEIGDVIIMYVLSPRSFIHSVWRAIRPGAVEPFFGFYKTVYMGFPKKVPTISLAEMKADPVLCEMGLVRGNMQGVGGRLIPKKYYDRIVFLLEQKNKGPLHLPKLETDVFENDHIKTEQDVEVTLLEPLLRNLGFSDQDWQRQVTLQVGRSEKVIPDYVIFPTQGNSEKSIHAKWIWEAKLNITSHAQLKKDFEQASTYARLVTATGVGLISVEGIWIGYQKDNYNLEKARHWSGQQIGEVDHLNEIRSLAGKKFLG